jgi:hypothetical protein
MMTPIPPPPDDPDVTQAEPTTTSTWLPVDPAPFLDGTYEQPQTTELTRSDGVSLLYPGTTNALLGESESGKSWVAMYAVAQTLARGNSAVFLDFEATPATVFGRLRLLGATGDQLTHQFAYVQPGEPLSEFHSQALTRTLTDLYPTLVVLDGVTDAMGLHGLNPLDNADAAKFDRHVLRAITDRGPALLQVDHVPRSKDADGKYAIGAQHKRAAIGGASYRVEVVMPFAPGRAGWAKLLIAKDRHGAVREVASSVAAEFHLDATDKAAPIAELRPPSGGSKPGEPFRPTFLMERVSRHLEGVDEPCSVRTVVKSVEGQSKHVQKALSRLVEEGFVRVTDGPKSAKLHRSVRPFRDNGTIDRVPFHPDDRVSVSDRVPDRVPAVSPTSDDERVSVSPVLLSTGHGTRSTVGRSSGEKLAGWRCPECLRWWRNRTDCPSPECPSNAEATT